MAEGEDIDKIPLIDRELEAQRQAKRKAKKEEELNNPSLDKLAPQGVEGPLSKEPPKKFVPPTFIAKSAEALEAKEED